MRTMVNREYLQNMSVFIVDDDINSLNFITEQLKVMGLRVTPLISGEELLELLGRVTPDLIILDVIMEHMNGFEVCSRIKSETYASDVPVIFMSALGDDEDRIRGFREGAVDYIMKPVREEELQARVKVQLELVKLRKKLKKRNSELQREITERVKSEMEVTHHKEELEALVSERTIALQRTNFRLKEEVERRRGAELQIKSQLEELENSKKQLLMLLDEEQKVKEKLRINEERLSMAIDASGSGIYETSVPFGDKLFFSEKWNSIIGYSSEELPEKREFIRWFLNRVHPADIDKLVDSIRAFVKGTIPDHNIEFRVRHKSGNWVYVQGLSRAIEFDKDGKVIHVIGLMTDITERKKTESRLMESEAQLKRAQEVAHIGSWYLDVKMKTLVWSDETYRIFGIPVGTVMTYEHFLSACHPEDRGFINEAWLDAINGQSYNIEHRIVVDGKVKWVIEKAEVEFDEDDTPYRGIGTIQDITDRKREEEKRLHLEEQLWQSQKMDAVGQLAGGVAHDFNNLLQVIGGYTDLVKEILEEESPVQKHLGLVMKATERAASLVRQLLLFSRNEKPVFRNIEINELVTGILRMLERIIGENVNLEFEAGDKNLNVFADAGQIEQIIMNLCLNARDALEGGGTVKIATGCLVFDKDTFHGTRICKPGNYVVLTVTDNGCGMKHEVKERIFEPFFTTKDEGKGTGLGLATVYAITKRHDGFIDVSSEPGAGSEFNVYLPGTDIAMGVDDEAGAEDAPVEISDRYTVLVAEDDALVRELSTRILLHSGYKVIVASNGDEAEDIVERRIEDVDIAVLDMVMPGKGGKEIFDRIKELKPELPVIFSTGYTTSVFDDGELDINDIIFLRKPFRKKEFLNAVATAVERSVN